PNGSPSSGRIAVRERIRSAVAAIEELVEAHEREGATFQSVPSGADFARGGPPDAGREGRPFHSVPSGSDFASGGPTTSNAFVSAATRVKASTPRCSAGSCADRLKNASKATPAGMSGGGRR